MSEQEDPRTGPVEVVPQDDRRSRVLEHLPFVAAGIVLLGTLSLLLYGVTVS